MYLYILYIYVYIYLCGIFNVSYNLKNKVNISVPPSQFKKEYYRFLRIPSPLSSQTISLPAAPPPANPCPKILNY